MFKAIRKWWNEGWEELKPKEVPNWIKKKKGKFWRGYHFLYKIKGGKYYRKNRGLEYPEGIPKKRKGLKRWQKGNQVIYQPKDFRDPFEP